LETTARERIGRSSLELFVNASNPFSNHVNPSIQCSKTHKPLGVDGISRSPCAPRSKLKSPSEVEVWS